MGVYISNSFMARQLVLKLLVVEEFCTRLEENTDFNCLILVLVFKNLQVRASNRIFQPMKGTGIAWQVVVGLVDKKDIVKNEEKLFAFVQGGLKMHNVRAVDIGQPLSTR